MILLIHGEDDFLAREKLNFFKSGFIKKYGDLNVSVYNSENNSINTIINDILSAPFLSEKRMIILEDVLGSWKKDERVAFAEKLKVIPESNIVLIFEGKNLEDKKSKIIEIKDLRKIIDNKNIYNFKRPSNSEMISFIQGLAKKNGYLMDTRAANTLVGLVGTKSREISQEMKKLFAYKYDNKKIDAEDIKEIARSQLTNSVFDFTDALSKKEFKKAKIVLINLFESGENPINILATITTHFRNLLYIKISETEGVNKEKLLSETRMHPFVYQKTSFQAKRFTMERLKEIYQDIKNTDIAIKTGEQEGELALDLLIGKICL